MAASMSMVAVWEWYNEFGKWRQYDPHISDFIERHANQKGLVYLGNADPNFTNYIVDLSSLQQVRQGTGTRRHVQRKLYPSSSPAGTGVQWQWSGDIPASWNSYDMEAQCILEDAFSRGQPIVDLSQTPCQVPYTIDIKNMQQTRNETGFVRRMQRIATGTRFSAANPNAIIVAANMGGQSFGYGTASATASNQASAASSAGHSSLFGALSPSGNLANNPFNLYSSGNISHKPGGVTKKKSQFGLVYNGSPKLTRQTVRSIAAHHQQMQHVQHQPVQPQQLQQQHQPQQQLQQQQQHQGYQHLQRHQQLQHQQQQHQQQQQQQQQAQHAYGMNSGSLFPTSTNHMGHVQNPGLPFNQQYPVYIPSQQSAPTPALQAPKHTVTTGPSMAPMISPAMTGMTNMLVLPAVPVMITPSQQPKTHKSTSTVVSNSKGGTGADTVIQKYGVCVTNPPKDTDCCICCESLNDPSGYTSNDSTVYKLKRCEHMYHYSCIKAMYDSGTKDGSLQCPTCKEIYGEKRGNCPYGQMQVTKISQSLHGYPECGTIRVEYYISQGIQGTKHPAPGQPFSARGFPRYGYLPDNERGNKLARLLMIAWERKLTFTIGTSVTTGESHTVVWNEIHHKTEFGSNRSGHGYPDPNYMDNLTMELSVHGITEEDLKS